MQLEHLLEQAREILSQDEFRRFQRLLHKRHDLPEPVQRKATNELDEVLKLEIEHKEHEIALRRRGDQLHERGLEFEKKRAAKNQARNAKVKKQQEEREKRILDMRHGSNETGNSVAIKVTEKQTQAAIRRDRIRERIVENARSSASRPKADGDVSGVPDGRILQEPLHFASRKHRGPRSDKRERKGIKPRVLSRSKATSQSVAIDSEARIVALLDKLKSREEQVARNRADIRRSLQDKSQKLEERCQKNLRFSRDISTDKQNRDLDRYRSRHVLKDRLILQKEQMKKSIKSFVDRRLIHSKRWEQNREKISRKEFIRHELRLQEILRMHQKPSTTDVSCDDQRRVNRMRFKARRKRIIRRIRNVRDLEELEKMRQKLSTVETQ